MLQRIVRFTLICAITGLAALMVWPYHDVVLRFGLPLCLLVLWLALLLSCRSRRGKALALTIPVFAATPFCLPGKAGGALLSRHYFARLSGLQGTPYVWGGESHRGIDCSGLPRRALREALLDEAVANLNGGDFREWARQWWFDTSAKALGEKSRGFTRPLGIAGRLRDLDVNRLQPGDLAIVGTIHVVIYMGGGDWIQADPGSGKVIIENPVTSSNPWFDSQVTVHRWTVLDE